MPSHTNADSSDCREPEPAADGAACQSHRDGRAPCWTTRSTSPPTSGPRPRGISRWRTQAAARGSRLRAPPPTAARHSASQRPHNPAGPRNHARAARPCWGRRVAGAAPPCWCRPVAGAARPCLGSLDCWSRATLLAPRHPGGVARLPVPRHPGGLPGCLCRATLVWSPGCLCRATLVWSASCRCSVTLLWPGCWCSAILRRATLLAPRHLARAAQLSAPRNPVRAARRGRPDGVHPAGQPDRQYPPARTSPCAT